MTRKKNPFEEIERMLEKMSKQFQESDQLRGIESALPGRLNVDLGEFEDAFEVTADLPGFDSENIEVEIIDDQLRIRADRETETEAEAESPDRYIRRERKQRSIDRRVSLPEPVAEEDVEATFTNGVLTVCLPKSNESEETTQIDIE
ncbi:Hsp20/alpha crystallin family protein [Halodesulfurarchaeum sp.]|uniref:Hsp20/alpha crystallin family protein n=1 Tax=Halodesulfurarchaeum sp. TaxID=1980530 RepID=UPI001BC2C93E|nr:Hsp20/alpha crystallin family protein [Halodesulfurarchaeum sp.]